MGMFRLLQGTHCNGDRDPITNALIVHRPGEVFFSPSDLVKKFNSPDSLKFEPLPDGTLPTHSPVAQAAAEGFRGITQTQVTPDPSFDLAKLQAMDMPALIKLAQEEEIDLGTLKKKEEIVSRIQKALTSPALV